MNAKVLLISCALASVHATNVVLVNTGVSSTSRTQNEDGSYTFNYEIVDAQGASNSRSEVGDAYGNKQGSYNLHDTDGRDRRVNYIADKNGYRAVVHTNEPGTALSAPAAAVIDSPNPAPVAPEVPVPVAHPAPVVVAPVAHPAPVVVAPVAHPAPVVVAPVAHLAPASTTKFTVIHDVPVAHPAPVVVAPVAHPAPVVVAPVAHPAPVVVDPVAHPAPITTTRFSSSVVHGGPVVYGFPRRLVAPVPISLGFGIAPYSKAIGYKGTPYFG